MDSYNTYVKYQKYKAKYDKYKKDLIDSNLSNSNKNKSIVLISASWCPHCKNFMPVWNELKNNFSNVKFINYDASELTPELNQKYNTDGVPSIFIDNGTTISKYNDRLNKSTLENFISNM